MAAVRSVEAPTHAVSTPTMAEQVRAWLRDPWIWVVALVALVAVVLSTDNLVVPLDRDEGAFLAVAQRMLQGGVPYRDVFDQKGPAIYYYLAGVLTLTRPLQPLQRILVARVGVVIVDLLTGVGIFMLGRRGWTREVGLLAALFWFIAVPLYNGDQFFTEPFATAGMVWALVVADKWPTVRGALAAGALLALGSMFKQTALLSFPAVAIVALAGSARAGAWWQPSRQRLMRLGGLIVGTAFPWLGVAAAFAVIGGLGPFMQQVVIDNLVHYPADSLSYVKQSLTTSLDAFRVLWLIAGLAMVVGVVRWLALRRMPGPGAIALAIALILGAAPFRTHAYNHYFLQLVPMAALLAAVLLMAAFDAGRSAVGAREADTGAPGTHGRALLTPALLAAVVLIGMNRPLPMTQWHNTYPGLKGQVAVGNWIVSHMPAGAQLFVFPAEPEYYYLANRTTDAPYVYVLPVNMTDTLMNHLSAQVIAHYYPVIVWQQSGGGDGHEPYYASFLSTIRANYHMVARYQEPEIYIFVPNA